MSWSRRLLCSLCAAAAALPSLAAGQTALTRHDLMLLNRITWGATPADAAHRLHRRRLDQDIVLTPIT